MEISVRELVPSEYSLLDIFLYHAIFIPKGTPVPPKDIIDRPELRVYVDNFGGTDSDIAFAAFDGEKAVGAVWVRIMDDYGHIDNETPSFAISVLPGYRNSGTGTRLMRTILSELKKRGFKKASLSVQKANFAAKMYLKLGFEIVRETDEEYIMMIILK